MQIPYTHFALDLTLQPAEVFKLNNAFFGTFSYLSCIFINIIALIFLRIECFEIFHY
jgi:hypothetical protein